MGTLIGPVVELDMSKAHHWLVVQSQKHGCIHVTCVDCNDSREYPFGHLDTLTHWLEMQDDVQVLSWVSVDAR